MLVAGGGGEPGAARLLRAGADRPDRRGGDGSAAALQAIDVSFGDAAQVFHIGPASCGVYGTPAGVCAAVAALGDDPAGRPGGAGRAAGARGRRAQRRAGLRGEDPRRPADLHARVRGAVGAARAACCARASCCATPSSATRCCAWAARAPSPSTAGDVAAAVCDWLWARGGSLSAEDLAGYRAIEREPVRMGYRDREVLTNPPPSAGGTLLAYSLALLDRGPSPPTLRGVVAGDGGGPVRAHARVPRGARRGGLPRALPRDAPRLDHAHLGARRATGARAAARAPTARARASSCRAPGSTSTT